MNIIFTTLIDLGLNKFELDNHLYKAAVTEDNELKVNKK